MIVGEVRGKSNMAANNNFMWTDKINALLHVVLDYKVGKAGEGVDWETVRSKYENITKMFLEKSHDNYKNKFPRGGRKLQQRQNLKQSKKYRAFGFCQI